MVSDTLIARTITALLARRKAGSSICPSEAARALSSDDATWRGLMPRVRGVAQTMRRQGQLRITRGGEPLGEDLDGGPIRLHRGDAFGDPSDPL
jgi:hypothetical protein